MNEARSNDDGRPAPHDQPEVELLRYARQFRFAPFGLDGQRRVSSSRALICGCGALGTVLAGTLARAGVGNLRIVDRDFLELSNLQRQTLFDEDDLAAGLPKAVAASAKLRRINSQIAIEPIVADVDHANIGELIRGVDVIVDGTDNFETRFLLNDVSLKHGIPWVYGGCLGAEGQTMTILPGETPCLRCLMFDAPPPGTTETCDTAGILGPIINVIASIQACEALKILAGKRDAVSRSLAVIDLWDNRLRSVQLDGLKSASADCPACTKREFPWLDGRSGSHTAVLCGRNAVQLVFPGRDAPSLEQLAGKLSGLGRVTHNRYLLRLAVDKYQITLFADGRAIVGGTNEIAEARSAYARYIGS